jgi:hypothetical protein
MVILRNEYGADPHEPPIAGRGGVIAYYRHEDGLDGPAIHAIRCKSAASTGG